jgi:hypothetical protein
MLRKRLLFLSLAAVGLVGCNQRSASPTLPKEGSISAGEIGSPLPDFSVKDLQGREISSALTDQSEEVTSNGGDEPWQRPERNWHHPRSSKRSGPLYRVA